VKKRVNVLIVHNKYRSDTPSGENIAVQQFAENLELEGHAVKYAHFNSDDWMKISRTKKILGTYRLMRGGNPDFVKDLPELIDWAEIVHCHNLFPAFGVFPLRFSKLKEKYIVFTLHNARLSCIAGSHFRNGKKCFKCNENSSFWGLLLRCYRASLVQSLILAIHQRNLKRELRTVDQILFLNKSSRSSLDQLNIESKKLLRVPTFSHEGIELALKEKSILFLGRLTQEKGVDLLIQSWMKSEKSKLNWTLNIVGDGELATEVKKATIHDDSIKFLGRLDRTQVKNLVEKAYAVVVPSVGAEGFPKVISEAAEAGCRVLTAVHFWDKDLENLNWAYYFEPTIDALIWQLNSLEFTEVPSKEAHLWWQENCSRTALQHFINDRYGISKCIS
jgi:glycosyltransferase involved in cell wall biosynthesis